MNLIIALLLITRFHSYALGQNPLDIRENRRNFPRPARISNLDADFIIGGLFPVRLNEKDFNKCSQGNAKYKYMATLSGRIECYRLNSYAVMWIEAMLFAIRAINQRSDILPAIQIGYDIRDTANNVDNAINCSLDFLLPKLNLSTTYSKPNQTIKSNCSCDLIKERKQICAVVGGAGSKISKAINYVLGVEKIPQISYSSTSPSLSNKMHFPSFLRTIPPDYIQAQVMAKLVSYYKWTYVSTIATDEDYGRLGIEAFKKEVKTRNVCISVDELFHPDNNLQSTKDRIKSIVKKLKEDGKATVVVLFCEGPNALAVLEEAEKQGLRNKIWIGTEAWGDKPTVLPFKSATVGGMLGVVPWKGDIEEFEKHMKNLTPLNSGHNPWFEDYWQGEFRCIQNRSESRNVTQCNQGIFNCSVTSSPANTTWSCPGTELPTAAGIQLNKAPNVMDSVYTIAWALHKMLNCTSGPSGTCPGQRSKVVPRDLLSYVWRTSFTGTLGYPVKFDEHGDTKGNYLIKSLQPDPDSPHGKRFVTIGEWSWHERKLRIHNTRTVWSSWNKAVPISRCSAPCPPGEYPVQGGILCCWTCVKCPRGSIKNTTGAGQCVPCKKGYTSDHKHSKCLKLPEIFLRWDGNVGLVILSLTGLGLMLTAFVLYVYLKFSDTAVVKASTREFSFLMLIIIALMFASSTLYLGRPVHVICQIRPFFFGFVVTFWTSLMLTKTNRLLLIFKRKRIPVGDGILGIRFQLVLAIILTVAILITALIWVMLFPPKVTYHYYDERVLVDCGNQSNKLLIIILGYTAVLAVTTTFIAYKARNLPENFNETRYISFSMFIFCIIWCTFVLLFYGTDKSIKSTCLCFSLLTTGFSTLICMFSSRLRIILFHPDKNRTEIVRASMFVYTTRDRNGSRNNTTMNMRRTSVITVGNFMLTQK